MADSIPTLYEWLGRSDVLENLTAKFYAKVKADPLLAPIFANMDVKHPHYVAQFLGEVFGGPTEYSSQRGGHAHMISKHFAPFDRGA